MEQLPVVSFQPDGRDTFMGLMMLMVGVTVEVTYLRDGVRTDPRTMLFIDNPEVATRRGEIVGVGDASMALRPYGLPARYTDRHYRPIEIEWSRVKMVEVIT